MAKPAPRESLLAALPTELSQSLFDRSRTRPPVDHGQFADDGPRPENREDTFPAGRRGNTRFEQAFLDSVTPVAFIPCHEQGLIGFERERSRLRSVRRVSAGPLSSRRHIVVAAFACHRRRAGGDELSFRERASCARAFKPRRGLRP